MQKWLGILEKNVEWMALGLAGLWVLWVAWSYWVTPPVVKLVDNKPQTPGQIDQTVADQKALLERSMSSSTLPEEGLQVRDSVAEFVRRMTPQTPQAVAHTPFRSYPPLKELKPGDTLAPQQRLVQELPTMPAPVDPEVRSGRSQVTIAPAAGTAPAPTATANNVDKIWVSVFSTWNTNDAVQRMQEKNVPGFLQKLTYVQVQVQREELMPDGSWGNPTLVPSLPMNAPPVDWQSDPTQFTNWAKQNEVRILQPDFYTVANGDRWSPPSEAADAQPDATTPTFDLQQSVSTYKALKTDVERRRFMMELTPEQRRMVNRAINEEERQNRPPPNPRYPLPRGNGDAQDSRVFGEMLAQDDDGPWMTGPGGVRIPIGPDGNPMPSQMHRPTRPLPSGLNNYDLTPVAPQVWQRPSNSLTPDAAGNLTIWAHDETVEPGKAYRYRMKVVVENPLYQTNQATDQLQKVYALESEWSEWSQQVSVPQNIKWWLVGGFPNAQQVRFAVSKWQNGVEQRSPNDFTVGAGDMIGSKIGEIDFTTGWTVADIRPLVNDTRVTLVDQEGRTQVRYMKADQANPEYRDIAGASSAVSSGR